MTEEQQKQIDSMSYIDMLGKWRFAPVGDPMFQGETGTYFKQAMFKRKAEQTHANQVAASKHVGWESR